MNETCDLASTTVLVVDDDPAVRDAVQRLLRSVGLAAIGYASPARLLAHVPDPPPACIVADMRMPEMNGLELHAALKAQGVGAPFILVTGYADLRLAVRAMRAGAIDLIEKPFEDQELIDSVQRAIRSGRSAAQALPPRDEAARRMARLTPREREVLALVVRGEPNKRIGRHLGLSTRTVEVYRSRMIEKMGAGSTAELVRVVTEHRLAAVNGAPFAPSERTGT
ncbi:MAG: response regulator transcription factor [Rhodocyclaceae bacterium]